MIDRDAIAIATLLAVNDIHQSALADLLIEKGFITEDEFNARIEKKIADELELGVENYKKVIRELTSNKKPPEGG